MHLTIKQLFRLTSLLIGVTSVVSGLIFLNVNKNSVYNELIVLDLLPRPENTTELYFDNSANLPTFAASGKAIDFTFIIHNLENTDYHYTYSVFVNTNGTKRIVDSENVVVKNNDYYTRHEHFDLTNAFGSQEVVVELTNKQQSIDFWMER
jgi:hypothetical protein